MASLKQAATSPARADLLSEVYGRLLAAYGPQYWWPAENAFEVVVGAILTQAAAWGNVEKALGQLKAAGALSPGGLLRPPEEGLARLIYPAGYYNAKARKLKAFIEMLWAEFGGNLAALLALPTGELRARLLATYGIGPETADAIVLYAAGKPVFVVDAYKRRIFRRIGVGPDGDSYEAWRGFFEERLPADPALYNEYHALLVRHGKETCRRREPRCPACPLLELCATGRARVFGVGS